jgi:hypothetical protein
MPMTMWEIMPLHCAAAAQRRPFSAAGDEYYALVHLSSFIPWL